jgi:photosystem II stability/assembly factor-like uncharacterized protein
MKNLNLMICIIFLGNFSAQAQWTKIETGAASTFNSVHFPSNDIGYVVSNNGLVLKSSDTGATWQFLDSLKTNLLKVHFFDNNTGIIVSAKKNIYSTVDGGINWTVDSIPELQYIRDAFVKDQTIFVMGDEGSSNPAKLFKSTDAGQRWNLIYEPDSFYFRNLFFIDTLNGYASTKGSSNMIYKTTDGGHNWVRINYTVPNLTHNLKAIAFSDKDVGFLGGWYMNHFVKTKDGGHNWQELKIHNGELPHIDFISIHNNAVYAGGYIIYRSLDLGETWERVSEQLGVLGVYDMHLFDEYNAVGVGFNGLIVRTTNGGGDDLSFGKKILKDNSIKVFPNPASDLLNIEIADGLTIQKLEILSTDGKVLRTLNTVGNTVNTSGFKTGMYFLRFYSSEGVSTMKLIIE